MKWEWPWKKTPPVAAEPKITRFAKPPIVLNILEKSKKFDDTPTQFMTYGWRWGVMTPPTMMIDEMIRTAATHYGPHRTIQLTADLTDKLCLKAAQMIPPDHIKVTNSITSTFLYIPADITFEDMEVVDHLSGLPSQAMYGLLRYIATRLESRLTSITVIHETGEFMAAFQSWKKNFTLEDNAQRWDGTVSDDVINKLKE